MSTHPTLMRTAILTLALLCAGQAQARPAVIVAEFGDATGKARPDRLRGRIVDALAEADQVDLVPLATVRSIAASRRVRPAELARPQQLVKVAQIAGADAVVMGQVRRSAGEVRLTVSINDVGGREVWSKQVPLDKGQLPPTLARRFAAAIAAAVGTRTIAEPLPPPPPPPPPARQVAQAEQKRLEDYTVIEIPPEPARAPPPPALTTREVQAVSLDDHEGEQEEEPLEKPAAFSAKGPRHPIAYLSTGLTFTWRTYRFCPEVSSCDEAPKPGAGTPVKYSTDRPYTGFRLSGDVFPLGRRDDLLRGLGVGGGYSRSLFLSTSYNDSSGTKQQFGSVEQRYFAEAIFRAYFHMDGAGEGWLGLRTGYAWHQFLVDPNPKIVESRRAGLYAALEGAVPLHRYVRLEGRGSLVPLASPGEEEKKAYGEAASGGGFNGSAGLTTDFGHPEWRIALGGMFDYQHFGDRYANPEGVRPETGRALEDYFGFSLMARASF